VDRRSFAVEVMRDSALFHADVAQLVPRGGDELIVLTSSGDGRSPTELYGLRKSDRRARRLPMTPDVGGVQAVIAHDTLFIAGGRNIVVLDLESGGVLRRGFRLDVHGDSLVYALRDTTEVRSWDFLGAVGAARELGTREAPFVRAAAGVLRATGLVYNVPEDRTTVTTRIAGGSIDADSELVTYDEDQLVGPYEIVVEGLEHPTLRPFLREVLRSGYFGMQFTIAPIMIATHDSASVPDLRVALTRAPYPNGAWVASALALLGDSVGRQWIGAALADTISPIVSSDTSAHIHHFVFDAAGRVQDQANVPRLLELLRDVRYSGVAVGALLDYRDPAVWERCLDAVLGGAPDAAARGLLYHLMSYHPRDDSADAMHAPGVRSRVRSLARRVLVGEDTSSRDVAADVIVRYGDVDDLPALIATLDLDGSFYRRAVLALVRLAGTGDEAMPRGPGTPAEWRAARDWWSAWYDRSRATFRAAPPDVRNAAWLRMLARLDRNDRE
jgi:hypothetical protein